MKPGAWDPLANQLAKRDLCFLTPSLKLTLSLSPSPSPRSSPGAWDLGLEAWGMGWGMGAWA